MSARLLPILVVAFAVYLVGHGDASASARRDASQLQLAEQAQSDQATLDAMQRRLDKLVPLKSSSEPLLIYHLAKAQAWLDFAFDARAQHDNSGAASEALAEANRLMAQLEAQANDIALDTTIVPSSRKLRDDIWLKAEAMKRHQSFRCAASRIAQFEVELVQAQADLARHRPAPIVLVDNVLGLGAQRNDDVEPRLHERLDEPVVLRRDLAPTGEARWRATAGLPLGMTNTRRSASGSTGSTGSSPSRGSSTFASLRIPAYRTLWLGGTASFLAIQMQFVVRGWLAKELSSSTDSATTRGGSVCSLTTAFASRGSA